MGSEEHWTSGREGLEQIVPSDRHEAPAHEGDARQAIDPRQLTHGIEEKNLAGRENFSFCPV
jgi:hypothetical protein